MAEETTSSLRFFKSKLMLSLAALVVLVIGAVFLTKAPISKTGVFGDMHLSSENLSALYDVAEPLGVVGEASDTVDFYCHVFEGPFCYLVVPGALDGQIDAIDASQTHRVERALAMRITSDLDPKLIERSKDGHVKARCRRSGSGYTCEADRGDGWVQIPIS